MTIKKNKYVMSTAITTSNINLHTSEEVLI